MKPAVVAQDEMFPDGDAGWMEMDEVTFKSMYSTQLSELIKLIFKQAFSAFISLISYFLFLFSCFSLIGCIRWWDAD